MPSLSLIVASIFYLIINLCIYCVCTRLSLRYVGAKDKDWASECHEGEEPCRWRVAVCLVSAGLQPTTQASFGLLAFLPSWQKSFWNQAECFPLSWYTLEAGMQACSLCSCHKEKHGNLTLRRFHGILGQQVANHVLVRTLASWGRGCTRLHSYPLCRSWAPLLDGLTGKAHPRSRFG